MYFIHIHVKIITIQMVWQIRYRSLCATHRHYVGDAIPFDPPISFGTFYGHNTRCPSSFANLPRHRLSKTQHFFISELQNGGINFHLTLLARVAIIFRQPFIVTC